MLNRSKIVVRVVFLTWAIFVPYYFWFLSKALRHTLPPYPWPAIIGLTYMASGIGFLVFITKRMFRTALEGEVNRSDARAKADHIAREPIYISSPDHLNLFNRLPWYSKWFGIPLSGFPSVNAAFLHYPAVYFASGTLHIGEEQLIISAKTLAGYPGTAYGSLAPEFCWTLSPNQVDSVQRFDMREILRTAIPLPFLRIQTNVGAVRDFLVCSGSKDIPTMIRETENIWYSLRLFREKGTSAMANQGSSRIQP